MAERLGVLVAGIAVFSVLSFLHAGPVVWGAGVIVACVDLLGRRGVPRWVWASLVVLGILVAGISAAPRDVWSPYYRVTVAPLSRGAVPFAASLSRGATGTVSRRGAAANACPPNAGSALETAMPPDIWEAIAKTAPSPARSATLIKKARDQLKG